MEFSERLRRLDLNLLPSLAALLELRHVTRAAERVGVGQPAMSETLRRLRRTFDDPLLVRTGNSYVRTPLGEALVEPVSTLLATAEKLLMVKANFDPATDEHEFTIVASDYVALLLLRPFLALVYREAPNISVRVIPVSESAVGDLGRTRVDLVILPRNLGMAKKLAGLPHDALFCDCYRAAVCRENAEVGDRIDRAAAERLPYLRYQITPDAVGEVDEQLALDDITTRVALTSHSLTLLPALLPETRMFAFVNQRLLEHSPAKDLVKIVATTIELQPVIETMYWHPLSQTSPAHQWLREKLTGIARSL